VACLQSRREESDQKTGRAEIAGHIRKSEDSVWGAKNMRAEAKFTVRGALGAVLFSFLVLRNLAQQPEQPIAVQTTIRVQSSLVLVDVISQDPKNGLPVRDFKKEDFHVYDNGNEVPITSFDAGAHYTARPLILWFAVICNEGGKIAGSAEFAGKEALLRPALEHLDKRDTVGVAHWCDNGETQIVLVPTEDHDRPIRVLAETIKPIPFHIGGNSNDVGEAAFRRMVHLIIQDAYRRNPQPLPVIVFLYGGRGAQPIDALNQMVDDILETSGIVFGIRDELSSTVSPARIGERGHFIHYIVEETGGEYLTAPAKGYAAALDLILTQLHFRYELGFIPPRIDGIRHSLRVELAKKARGKHKGIRLKFRPEYIPLSEAPDWAR
jgi:hypothetical protein